MLISATLLSSPAQVSGPSFALPTLGQTSQTGAAGASSARPRNASSQVSDAFIQSAERAFSTYKGPKAGPRLSRSDRDAPTSQAFAADIARRIAPDEEMDADALSSLEASLARTIDSVRGIYGKDAATAVMGAVYKNIGEAPVSEESLGAGFLDAIRLIDKNFGVSAGDAFIENLNGDLNDAMNAFFNNGVNEVFYASTSAAQLNLIDERALAAAGGIADAASALADALAPMDTAAVGKKKKSLLKELEEELEEKLKEKIEGSRMEAAIDSYTALEALPPGSILDLAV